MAAVMESVIREQLIDRKVRLESALTNVHGDEGLLGLLGQVDAALDRVESGVYGLCEVCHDTVESDRLLADPLVKVCIGCMGPDERRALEDDLELAATIQRGLLPERNLQVDGWHASYHYQPALHVSGDYCDLITTPERQLYFILGDVSGKGVAASMLMAHLHAMFRTLISVGLPLKQLMERASRVFCESTLPTHYATLVCGRADPDGTVEICNAGHLPPMLLQNGEVTELEANGLPVGVFCNEQFSIQKLHLSPGDALLLYTDGLTETRGFDGDEYGRERLGTLVKNCLEITPPSLVAGCISDLAEFRGDRLHHDDLTIMAIGRQ